LIKLFSGRSDIDLVIGLGGAKLQSSLPLPDNILVLEFAPQLEVIRCANIVITHGGISSINEALRCGVPLIGVSGKQVDQNGCLARIQHHALGVISASDMRNPDDIMALVDFLLSDAASGIRDNVKRVQAQLEVYEQQECAVRLLRDIAAKTQVLR
jgi:UDP:flavonoid glycosyltransferase YjiC (YdhE family)